MEREAWKAVLALSAWPRCFDRRAPCAQRHLRRDLFCLARWFHCVLSRLGGRGRQGRENLERPPRLPCDSNYSGLRLIRGWVSRLTRSGTGKEQTLAVLNRFWSIRGTYVYYL